MEETIGESKYLTENVEKENLPRKKSTVAFRNGKTTGKQLKWIFLRGRQR